MVVTLPKGAVSNKKKYGITHFLRIPLATDKSTPQLLRSLKQLSQDPIAAALPRGAWNTLDELHYLVGPLSLLKPGRLDRAIRLLRELDMKQIAKAIAATSGTDVVKQPASRIADTVYSVQAPIISLQGMGLAPTDKQLLRKTKTISCNIRESRPFLEQFRMIVSKIFEDADLIQVAGQVSRPITLKVMSTSYLRTNVPNEKPTLKGRNAFLKPSSDASDLIPKYRDFTWTTDFPLERLCISEVGLKDVARNGEVVRMGYHDIASVLSRVPSPAVRLAKTPMTHISRPPKL